MANYLARVAASGAASQPMARPSLIAPPVLPGRGHGPEPGEFASPRMKPVLTQTTPDNIAPRPQDRITPTPSPTTAATRQAGPSGPDDTPPVRPDSPVAESTSSRSSQLSFSRPVDPNVVHAPRVRSAGQESVAMPPRHFGFRPEPVTIVQLPRALGRAESVASGETVANTLPTADASPVAAVATPAQGAEPVTPPKVAATARQIEHDALQHLGDLPIERRIISAPQVGAGNNVVELPAAGGPRREPKITIGQIDVQVINTPTVTPQQPAASPSTSNVTNVELERVRWRPL